MRRLMAIGSCALGAFVVAGLRGQVPWPDVETDIRVDVLVTHDGRPVTGLVAADFEISDEGVRQQVESASPAARLSIALLLDTSLSVVDAGRLDKLVQAAEAVLAELQTADRVSLLTFDTGVRLVEPLTTDSSRVRRALETTRLEATPQRDGRTAVWDAVLAGASVVAGEGGRPVVVLLSDGADNASWLLRTQPFDSRWMTRQRERTVEALHGSGVVLDAVWVRRNSGSDGVHGPMSPADPARAAGGAAFNAADKALAERLRERLVALRAGYILRYTPAGVSCAGEWHQFEVRLRHHTGRVEARQRHRCVPGESGTRD